MLLLSKSEADYLISQLKLQHISVNLFIATDRGAHYRASGLVHWLLAEVDTPNLNDCFSKLDASCNSSP